MMTRRLVLAMAIVAALLQLNGQTKTAAKPKSHNQQSASTQQTQPANEGERVFRQNCSRCHNAPEGFSPSISGTIVRHMRVRANLSDKDVKALMTFLNPQ